MKAWQVNKLTISSSCAGLTFCPASSSSSLSPSPPPASFSSPISQSPDDRVATGPGRRTSRQSKRGGSTLAVRSSRGEPKTRGRTQRERDEDRENARTRQETRGENKKSARATRWKTRGDLLFCLGVARVHLIYRTLRNAEGTTQKLNHYPSEAPALQRALRPRIASHDAPALRPYKLRRVPTMLRCFSTMLRCFLYDVAMFSLRCSDASYGGS